VALTALLLPVTSAWAADITVTSAADAGSGSLRAALLEAEDQNHDGADTIDFAPTVTGAIELDTALPSIGGELAIVGPGQSVLTVRRALDATTPFGVFRTSQNSILSISGLTISNGKAEAGAGIDSEGPLTLTRVTVSGNENSGPEGGDSGAGIAASFGPLILRDSLVSQNIVNTDGAGAFGHGVFGAAVFAPEGGQIIHSTIAGNRVVVPAPVDNLQVFGGGIELEAEVPTTAPGVIEGSTIAGNTVALNGSAGSIVEGAGADLVGNVTMTGSTVTGNSAEAATVNGANLFGFHEAGFPDPIVRDSIVSNPRAGAPNCAGTLISEGFNIDDGSNCGFKQGSDRSRTNPGLATSLADNGGPTPTFALLPGSVAIDQGNAFGASADQRGLARLSDFAAIPNAPRGDGSDVGAFEAQAPPAAPKDTRRPNALIGHGPARTTKQLLAKFRFSSDEPGSQFECKLDRARFNHCTNPFAHRVKPGKHRFEVRAIDAAGNIDQTPAKYVWRVEAPRRHGPR
jgi:hypothetical protein